ncbi:MAG TPA: hypothetical protein VIX17_05470 [Pyrinomonadaceae bacterium]
MSGSTETSSMKTPLDAAQKIVAELQGMTPEHQALALKFSMETLGLQLQTSAVSHGHSTLPGSPLRDPTTSSASTGHSTDIKTFTSLKAPKSDQQFAAVVAYFYQFEVPPEQRKEVIDVETMKNAARLAGRKQRKEWKFTLQNAKNAGYLDAVGDGNYKLSSVGENLVAISLAGDAGSGVAAPGKKRRTNGATNSQKKKRSTKTSAKRG